MAALLILIIVSLWLIARLVLYSRTGTAVKTMIVLGSGGHTAEMFRIMDAMDKTKYSPRVYVVATTDKLGSVKARHHEEVWKTADDISASSFHVQRIPRSREVGQSWFTSTVTTAIAILSAGLIMLRHRPNLLLVNGPGTCLPLCIVAGALRALQFLDIKIVFVESIARTTRLSLTGKLLYRFSVCDLFLVQWPELCARFPKSRCLGRVY